MLRTLSLWELGLLAAFVVVMGQELIALLVARRQGLTRNVSRVVTFSSLLVLAILYGLLTLRLLPSPHNADAIRRLPTANWGYLVLGVMLTVVLAWELAALVQARMAGLTRVRRPGDPLVGGVMARPRIERLKQTDCSSSIRAADVTSFTVVDVALPAARGAPRRGSDGRYAGR
ncbi:MAG: hypothetical protein ACE5EG_11315 [Thermoanaerobaculia bacterium]